MYKKNNIMYLREEIRMEIVREIIEILFKIAIIFYMVVMFYSNKTILDCINTMQTTIIKQAQYVDALNKKVKMLEQEIERKKKGGKKENGNN